MMIKLESLYGYWVNCMDIWALVKFTYPIKNTSLPKEVVELANFNQSFFRLTIAYSLLYVVIEGYKELDLHDDEIDQLLENKDYVDSLKRLRNAIFHYQKEPLPKKLVYFIELQESAEWALKLKSSFENFFIKTPPTNEYITLLKRSL